MDRRYSVGKNIVVFVADMSSSVHIDNKNKDILVLSEEPVPGSNILY